MKWYSIFIAQVSNKILKYAKIIIGKNTDILCGAYTSFKNMKLGVKEIQMEKWSITVSI